MTFNPLLSFFRSLCLLLSGRMRFPRSRVGEIITAADGMQFSIFRQVTVDPPLDHISPPSALFQVRFRITGMSPRRNEVFSLLPVLFITGLPGFRSKLWMNDRRAGWCQGIYEWDSAAAAEAYAGSFAMRFMLRRAQAGSVSWRITKK
jgi:hypothetical protein